ncbi:hypothetical protein ACRRTK_006754 [Alexandromys fortis]
MPGERHPDKPISVHNRSHWLTYLPLGGNPRFRQERLIHKVGPVYFGEVNPMQVGGGRGGPRKPPANRNAG